MNQNCWQGLLVKKLFERVLAKRANKMPSFVLIIGDEDSDDCMFEARFSRSLISITRSLFNI